MSLAFHASPPPGEWLNDPNGLVHAGGLWRLFVQHRADAPVFRTTGWARLSSPDLLAWTWDGPVIAPAGDDWAYSGSVTRDGGGLVATHTVHNAATGLERQARRTSADAGASWSAAQEIIAAAANCRDPFVCDGGNAMLLARPCDWTDATTASQIAIWRLVGTTWREAGRIGPWHPAGVMWEVPVLTRVGGRDVLLISSVDRRGGGADCAVHAWVGALGADGFVRDQGGDPEGQRLDLGPDFYAAMSAEGAPLPAEGAPLIVGWLSSWATARALDWPGFAGGVISLPRRLSLAGGRVGVHVEAAIADAFTHPAGAPPVAGRGSVAIDGSASFALTITGAEASLTVTGDPRDGSLSVERRAPPPLPWRRRHTAVIAPCTARVLTLFVDGPAIELFIEPDGAAVSVALPAGDQPFATSLTVAGRAQPIAWSIRPVQHR